MPTDARQLDIVKLSFLKLKQSVYYDKNDLHLRKRFAEFETAVDFEDRLENVRSVVHHSNPIHTSLWNEWLKNISYRMVPKTVLSNRDRNKKHSNFTTNVTSSPQHRVDRVNYIFDGPIELHLVAIVWILTSGKFLDRHLLNNCHGVRLSKEVWDESDQSSQLYRQYHIQYSRWRDTAISIARNSLVNQKQSVSIMGLDFKDYFYSISIDWEDVKSSIAHYRAEYHREKDTKNPVGSDFLTDCIRSISETFHGLIFRKLRITHPITSSDLAHGLPIGMPASYILANWYLRQFDSAVMKKLRPVYYGRYVDDVLMVLPWNDDGSKPDPVGAFLQKTLVNKGILKPRTSKKQEAMFELNNPSGLFLQQTKCILQVFDCNHSIAGLEKFKKQLEENASDFALQPIEDGESSLEDVAYDLLFDGSANKFRSVKGVAENKSSLSKYLVHQSMLHLFTSDKADKEVCRQIKLFFKGSNAIEFRDLWERVLTFFQIANRPSDIVAFKNQVLKEISRLYFGPSIAGKADGIDLSLKESLKQHLALCDSLAQALQSPTNIPWRASNLIRHEYVLEPLLNYTNYEGSYIRPVILEDMFLDQHKIENSPRFVHVEELLLLAADDHVKDLPGDDFEAAKKVFHQINRMALSGVDIVSSNAKARKK